MKRGKNSYNAKSKDKRNQEPPKDGNPSHIAQEAPKEQQTSTKEPKGEKIQTPLAPVEPISPTKSSSPNKENISLNTNTDVENPEEEGT